MKIKIGYDRIDNACHQLLEEIAGKNLEWNAEAFAEVRDAVEKVMWDVYGIKLEFTDDSLCTKMEKGKTPIVVVTKDEKEAIIIFQQEEFGRRI